MYLGKNISFECLLSQSVSIPLSFKMQLMILVCLKQNSKWRNNISFKKDTEKFVLLQGLIKIIVRFRAEKILCTFFV